jgi:hypothetical protein
MATTGVVAQTSPAAGMSEGKNTARAPQTSTASHRVLCISATLRGSVTGGGWDIRGFSHAGGVAGTDQPAHAPIACAAANRIWRRLWGWHPVLVDESLALPGSGDRLVLVPASDGNGYCKAVVAERADGSDRWRAYPPEGGQDAWVAVRIDGDTVLANSYSGWLIRLDPESGCELERPLHQVAKCTLMPR